MRVGAVSGRVPSVEFLAPACIPNRTASTISPRCYSSLALQHRLGPLLRYIGTYLNRSCGTALWTVMPSLADLFPEFPLCQACEALFTAPRLADGELSIPEQIFQKYNRYKHKTDPEYHYQRSRGKLEKSVMLGCELYKRVAKDDLNYSHWKHKEQVHCEYEDSDEAGMCFDEGRPACYPPASEKGFIPDPVSVLDQSPD